MHLGTGPRRDRRDLAHGAGLSDVRATLWYPFVKMGPMKNTASARTRPIALDTQPQGSIEQLSLLTSASTPARFRLSKETRERGLRHVAEIRRMLAAKTDQAHQTPRHNRAA